MIKYSSPVGELQKSDGSGRRLPSNRKAAISLLFTRTLLDIGVLFMSPQSSEIGRSRLSISASLTQLSA